MLETWCINRHGSEQRRNMHATVAVVGMAIRIRMIWCERVMRVRMMLLVQTRCPAIMRHIHRIDDAFETGRKQAQDNQSCNRVPHRIDRLRTGTGLQATESPCCSASGTK